MVMLHPPPRRETSVQRFKRNISHRSSKLLKLRQQEHVDSSSNEELPEITVEAPVENGDRPNTLELNYPSTEMNGDSRRPSTPPDRLEGETEEDAEFRRAALVARDRTRKSVVVQIPTASIQMDLHTIYMDSIKKAKGSSNEKKTPQTPSQIYVDDENEKKNSGKFSMIRQKFRRDDTMGSGGDGIEGFRDLLSYIRSNLTETSEHELSVYKGSHWSTLSEINGNGDINNNCNIDKERFESLWELFYAEISYLMDHLIVLYDVFAKQLQHTKSFGFLSHVNEDTLFVNLQSLIIATTEFAKRLIKIFKDYTSMISNSIENIVDAFNEFDKILTPQYNEYCLNYQNAKNHLKALKDDEMFMMFVKWCEEDRRCNRLRIEDFLVAPLQHLTKYPLLLKAIRKRTPATDRHTHRLSTTIMNIEKSIKSVEKKYTALINLQRIQEIHEALTWPLTVETEKLCLLPDEIKTKLSNSHCGSILMNPNRELIQEGFLTLTDNNKTEFYAFLFDDMFLLTKFRKKQKQKRTSSTAEETRPVDSLLRKKSSLYDSASSFYAVYKQPIPLDRLKLYNCDETFPVKNSFCVIHYNRYHQPVSAYTLVAPSPEEKKMWYKNIERAADQSALEPSTPSTQHQSSEEEYML